MVLSILIACNRNNSTYGTLNLKKIKIFKINIVTLNKYNFAKMETENINILVKPQSTYINPYTDFGFKKLLAKKQVKIY